MDNQQKLPRRGKRAEPQIPELIANAAEPLPDLDDPEFGKFFDRFADRRIVLLGEARQK